MGVALVRAIQYFRRVVKRRGLVRGSKVNALIILACFRPDSQQRLEYSLVREDVGSEAQEVGSHLTPVTAT